ncbi:MAG: carbohydrate porin [Nitrospinae bacterium]|nr:carbohydrate porin [Nitrospinota bacterium]
MSTSNLFRLSLAFVAGLLVSAPAFAQEAEQEESAWYEGVVFEGGLTAILQGTAGNDTAETKDQTDYAYSADFAAIAEVADGHTLAIVFEAGEGEGANDNLGSRAIPDYDGYLSQVEGAAKADVNQIYYEGAFFDGAFTLLLGKMDFHALTDGNEYAGDETSQFLNGLFVRSAGVIFAEHEFYYAPTVAVILQPVEVVSLTLAHSKHVGDDLFSNGYQAAELGIHLAFGDLAGNYRFGYLRHDVEYHAISDGSVTANTGWFVSADQAVTSGVGLFVRYAKQDDSLVENEVTAALSGGLSLDGDLWGRPGDGIGLAYGALTLNTDLVTEFNEGESVVEAYYRYAVSEGLTVTADAQGFQNLERAEARSVSVFSLRMQAGF